MIVLLSQNSYSSAYVRSELDHALFDAKYRHRILPVLMDAPGVEAPYRVPWILNRIHFLPLSQGESGRRAATKIADAFIALLEGKQEDVP